MYVGGAITSPIYITPLHYTCMLTHMAYVPLEMQTILSEHFPSVYTVYCVKQVP